MEEYEANVDFRFANGNCPEVKALFGGGGDYSRMLDEQFLSRRRNHGKCFRIKNQVLACVSSMQSQSYSDLRVSATKSSTLAPFSLRAHRQSLQFVAWFGWIITSLKIDVFGVSSSTLVDLGGVQIMY